MSLVLRVVGYGWVAGALFWAAVWGVDAIRMRRLRRRVSP